LIDPDPHRSMYIEKLPTPSLLLDLARVRRNAERFAALAKREGVRLRPHVKTHKCAEIARVQAEGAGGAITVSTLAEARFFAERGFRDITYAVPIEPGKFDDAINLSRRVERLSLVTDDTSIPHLLDETARRAGATLDLFLKVDCGSHRCGVEPDRPEAREIPRLIDDANNLRFAGILTHAGHSYHCKNRHELLALARHERDLMAEFATTLRRDGVEVPDVSIGSTPTVSVVDHLEGVTEIRPGNYIFFDAFQATLGSCRFDDCALTVLASVVHRDPVRKKVVIDAGALALSKDRGAVELDPRCGYGHVLDAGGNEVGLRVDTVSQEHGQIFVEDKATFDRLLVGTRLRVLANHSCLTAAQHTHYNVLESGSVVDRWEIQRGW
jgi:D-serine deaminase-like pyridoxal phosphate-dependent protein